MSLSSFHASRLYALFLALTPLALAAQQPAPPAAERRSVDSPVAAAWDAYRQVEAARDNFPRFSAPNQSEPYLTVNYVARHAAARAVWKLFPEDPRRWDAAYEFVYWSTTWLKGRGLLTAEDQVLAEKLQQQLLTAADVPEELRGRVAVMKFQAEWNDIYAVREGYTPDLTEAGIRLDKLAQRYPDAKGIDYLAYQYHSRLNSLEKAKVETWAREHLNSPSPQLAAYAGGVYRHFEAVRKPVEMKFTALDGREVDLRKLRGKVVLLDFWGTWCGPCVAEIPNLRRVYEQYHDKGFEVIGIAADENRDKLVEFLKDKGVAWPQHFDGRNQDNEWVQKFSVRSFPTLLLLNKKGLLVGQVTGSKTEPRIEELERKVKEQLAL